MSSARLRIAIIGAGPAGLTLGLLLHKRGIPFTIFDLRQRPTDEELAKPSGSLDLHEETGLAALQEGGLLEAFHSLKGDCSEAQRVANKHGTILHADEGEDSNRPEISRHRLVELLLSNIPASAFKWGWKLIRASPSSPTTTTTSHGHAEIELDFGTQGKESFDLVVGADGAWSKVRALLTDVKPQYSGIQNITINLRQIKTNYPELDEYIGSGTFTSLGDRHGVFSQRAGAGNSARIYIFISAEDENFPHTTGLSKQTPAEAKQQLIGDKGSLFHDWADKIKALVAAACDDESADTPNALLDIKPLYQLPVGHTWQHKPGATLIGDASHLMCPWAGEGVNLAMRDALLLSRAIAETLKTDDTSSNVKSTVQEELDSRIKDFEKDMAEGAKVEAEGTLENGQMMFGSDDGAATMAEFFKNAGAPPPLE